MTMYWLTKYSTVRIAVLALYVLASIGVGFAHKNPYAATGDLTISVLPDGTPLIICSTIKGSDTDKSAPADIQSAQCEACLLTAAPGLAAPSDHRPGVVQAYSIQNFRLYNEAAIDRVRNGATLGARGPPVG